MSQNDTPIFEVGNMTIKGASLITMAQDATKTTSRDPKRKARFDPKTIEEIKKEAKKLIFFNSAKYVTATKQADTMMKPKETILFRQSSKKVNHPHLARVKVHNPQ